MGGIRIVVPRVFFVCLLAVLSLTGSSQTPLRVDLGAGAPLRNPNDRLVFEKPDLVNSNSRRALKTGDTVVMKVDVNEVERPTVTEIWSGAGSKKRNMRTSKDVASFVEWLQSHQVPTKLWEIRRVGSIDSDNFGLYLRDNVRAATMLSLIPSKLIFQLSNIGRDDDPFWKSFKETCTAGNYHLWDGREVTKALHALNCCAAALLFERAQSSSFWAPYFNMLPRTISGVAGMSDYERIALMRSRVARDEVAEVDHQGKLFASFLDEVVAENNFRLTDAMKSFSEDDLNWALHIVRTRGISFATEVAILPLMDLMNHGPVPSGVLKSVKLQGRCPAGQEGVCDQTGVAYETSEFSAKGTEFTKVYDGKGSIKLMVESGFLSDGPLGLGVSVSTVFNPPPDQPFGATVKSLVDHFAGLQNVTNVGLTENDLVPDLLVKFLRLRLLEPEEFVFATSALANKVISLANEQRVLLNIAQPCREWLVEMDQALQEEDTPVSPEDLCEGGHQACTPQLRRIMGMVAQERKLYEMVIMEAEKRWVALLDVEFHDPRLSATVPKTTEV